MPISTSAAFKAQATADSNCPASKVQLVLGDYLNSNTNTVLATASSTDGSGNYPASGALNGDRTELNIGAPATADNGIGKSSWKSAASPTVLAPVFFIIDIPGKTQKTINRIKIYHLSGHGLKEYAISGAGIGSGFVIARTSGAVGVIGGVVFTSTGTVDIIDFPDVAVNELIIGIQATQVPGDVANIVEVEAYRLVDITERVISIQTQQSRDYKIANPMATSVRLTVDNSDRFFSPSHNPTPAEILQGFVNQELIPNIGIIVSQGFSLYSAAPEIYQTFVGYMDSLSAMPINRAATIQGRDGMKQLINRIDTCNLKTSIDIANAILYLLNRSNISTFDTNLAQTGINIDYFFTDSEQVLTTIQDLVQGAGDAIFYFDNNGIATFNFYTNGVTNQHVYTSQTDWQAGTLTAMDTTTIVGDLLMAFSSTAARATVGLETNLAAWRRDSSGYVGTLPEIIVIFGDAGSWTIGGSGLQNAHASGVNTSFAQTRQSQDTWIGRWDQTIGINTQTIRWAFASNTQFENGWANSYSLLFTFSAGVHTVALCRKDYGLTYPIADTVLASATFTPGATDVFTISRYPSGRIVVLKNTAALFDVVDTTFNGTSMDYQGFQVDYSGASTVTFGANPIYHPVGFIADDILPVLDTGVSTTAFGLLTDTSFSNGGKIYYKTRSGPAGHPSPDGSWTAWSAAFPAGSGIPSAVGQYLQVDVFEDSTPSVSVNPNASNPDILDVTVNWSVGSGSPKYPLVSSFTFSFDSSLIDITQEIADTLGGDSAILNDVSVQAQPNVLTGLSSDTVWQGTVGTPPIAISAGTPLSVSAGTYTFPIVTSGMDTSAMSGGSPAAAVVTFGGGGAGTWSFIKINPINPVLQIVVSSPGTITDLRVVGKQFASANYIQVQTVQDIASINRNGDRSAPITNPYIVSASIALLIATALVANSKNAVLLIPTATVEWRPDLLLGDRVTIVDVNLDLNGDYVAVGVTHTYAPASRKLDTQLTLLAVP